MRNSSTHEIAFDSRGLQPCAKTALALASGMHATG